MDGRTVKRVATVFKAGGSNSRVVTIPKPVANRMGIEPGDLLSFETDGEKIIVKKI